MKKSNAFNYVIIALILVFSCFSYYYIIPNIRNYYNLINIIFWMILASLAYLILNYGSKKEYLKKDFVQLSLIYTIMFLIIYFLVGIFIGFAKNPIAITPLNIIKNVFIYGTMILLEEFIRTILLKNSAKNKLLIIIITLLFTFVNLIFDIYKADFNTGIGIFKFISISFLPCFSKNILLTYLSYNAGWMPGICYRLIMELSLYILPIFPNFGEYVDSIILFIYPFLLLFSLIRLYSKSDRRIIIQSERPMSKIFLIISTIFVMVSVLLISGLFKYQAIGIVSNSMYPYFKRGDTVIFEHIDQNYDLVKVGDVLVYKNEDIYVVHRVVSVTKQGIVTKGDNNEYPDKNIVKKSDIVGIQKVVIPIVGYPSVWLQELLSK